MQHYTRAKTLSSTLLLATALLCGGFAGSARAQVGGASVIFLMIEPDSRATGMGSAGVALADNANAIFWNPAGLAYQEGTEAGLTHSSWLSELDAGLSYEYLVAKHRLGRMGTLGTHVTFLNLGEHERRDELGEAAGNFRSYDLAAGLSYGKTISEHFSLGGGVRLIYSDLAGGSTGNEEVGAATSVGLDLAGLYRSSRFSLAGTETTFSAGFNLANVGPGISYLEGSEADPLPTNMRMGYAFTFELDEYNTLSFANDFTKLLVDRDSTGARPFYESLLTSWQAKSVRLDANAEKPTTLSALDQLTIGLGAEYWYQNRFALRSGYFHEHPYNGAREFMTFGAGLRYNIVAIDFSYIYALEEDHPLANTMRFSLLLNFAK